MGKVFLGSDHRGFNLKSIILKNLQKSGYSVTDIGFETYDPKDDYPDIAIPLSKKVADHPKSIGVLICGSGNGVTVVANKTKKIRAVLCFSKPQALATRSDDDPNILCLSSDYVSQKTNLEIVKTFLTSKFKKLAKNVRRIKKISKYEST